MISSPQFVEDIAESVAFQAKQSARVSAIGSAIEELVTKRDIAQQTYGPGGRLSSTAEGLARKIAKKPSTPGFGPATTLAGRAEMQGTATEKPTETASEQNGPRPERKADVMCVTCGKKIAECACNKGEKSLRVSEPPGSMTVQMRRLGVKPR